MATKNYTWLVVWLGASFLAIPFDDSVFQAGWHKSQGFHRDMLTAVDYMSGYSIHLLVICILASSLNRKQLFLGYGATMIGQGLVTGLIKMAVGRARPSLGMGPFHFRPFGSLDGMNSFPSGDAVAAMALATLFGIYFPKSRKLFWILGIAAGLARVARGRHYLSDVIFGAGLGYALTLMFFSLLGPERFAPRPPAIQEQPFDYPQVSSPERGSARGSGGGA